MLIPESARIQNRFWDNLIIQGLRLNPVLHTSLGNQTLVVLRISRTLQTFGETLITQVLKMVIIMALLKAWKQADVVMAPWAWLVETMKIILTLLKW